MQNNKLSSETKAFITGFLLLAGLLIFTVVFMLKQIGIQGLGTFIGFGLVFSPMLIAGFFKTKRRRGKPSDPYLDPINKGLEGNFFNEK